MTLFLFIYLFIYLSRNKFPQAHIAGVTLQKENIIVSVLTFPSIRNFNLILFG